MKTFKINPKSVPLVKLYGVEDRATNEWKDGIAARIFRECETSTSVDYQWVLFDGPVDALWIENMNTVLDDNKKLCLSNGEIIKVADQMNILFEVEELGEASPATISRCGMVFVR